MGKKVSRKCRFCECPVSEGGVLLSEVDQDALSSWWSKRLHIQLDRRTLRGAWSCRQCIWDARFWHENYDGELEADLVWWRFDDPFYKSYKEHELKPFSVVLNKLGESDFKDVQVEKICCKFCEEKFFFRENLDLHLQRNHQNAPESQLLKCLFCSMVVRKIHLLNKHLKDFHKAETIWCKYTGCCIAFKSEKMMEEHFKEVHQAPGKNPIKCKVCKKWFANKLNLRAHLKNKHPEKFRYKNPNHPKVKSAKIKTPAPLVCAFCSESFNNKMILFQHTKKKHEKLAVKCKFIQCRTYFKTKKQMEEHFEEKHKKLSCQFCHSSFSCARLLSKHLKMAHIEKKCKLFKCNFYPASEEEREKHVEENHDKKVEPCECIFCGKLFANKLQRSGHVRKFHSHIAIKCDHSRCSHIVKNVAELEEHKKEAHPEVEKYKKSIVCIFCNKTISGYRSYYSHLNLCHSADEVFRCKYHNNCFTFFKNEVDLKKHYEEKLVGKFTCDFCGHNCSNKSSLKNHIRIGHLPRETKCPLCPKLFGGKWHLRQHIKGSHQPKKVSSLQRNVHASLFSRRHRFV